MDIIAILVIAAIVAGIVKAAKASSVSSAKKEIANLESIEIANMRQYKKDIKKLVDEFGNDGLYEGKAKLIPEGNRNYPETIYVECHGYKVGTIPKKLNKKIGPLIQYMESIDAYIDYDEKSISGDLDF